MCPMERLAGSAGRWRATADSGSALIWSGTREATDLFQSLSLKMANPTRRGIVAVGLAHLGTIKW